MADQLILLPQGDVTRGQRIIQNFAERTGLTPESRPDGAVRFGLSSDDHRLKVVETLNDIDSDWPRFVALGDPASN